MTSIAGAAVLVTGATGGIGRAILDEVRSRDGLAIATGRDRVALTTLAATGVAIIEADLAAPGGVESAASRALAAHGRIDVLINCAGVGWAGDIAVMEPADIERLMAVDLYAPLALTQAVLVEMLARGRGHIVNIASIAGHTGVAEEAVYSAMKSGLIAFSDALRLEVGGRGIQVTVVSPGAVRTDFFARRDRPYTRSIPRQIGPEAVARATLDALEKDRAQVFVPAWLGLAARLKGAAPGLYRVLARRFG
jgi:short-subunit dehydrogenase